VPNARARIAIDGGCRKRLIALALAVATSGCSFLVDADGLTDASSDDDAGKRTGSDNASSEDPAPSAPPDGSIASPPPDGPSSPLDAGAESDASDDASEQPESDATNDAEPDAGDRGIACGPQTCAPGSQVCCYSFDAGPLTCASSCPSDQLALPCDDTADCVAAGHPSSVCCATLGPAPEVHATKVVCTSSCPTKGATPLCDPLDRNICPSGDSCQPSTLNVPGYHVCK